MSAITADYKNSTQCKMYEVPTYHNMGIKDGVRYSVMANYDISSTGVLNACNNC